MTTPQVASLRCQLEQQAMHAEQLRCLLDAARREGTPKGEGAKRVLGMAFEKIRDLQGRLDLLTAEHASLQQRQQAHAARVEEANCLAASLLQALGGAEDEQSPATDPSWRLPARLRAALVAAQAPPSAHEELRQLRDELQATIREKASIAAENAALRTEIRSLETRAALLEEQAESTAERAAVLEQRAQRTRGIEEQVPFFSQAVEAVFLLETVFRYYTRWRELSCLSGACIIMIHCAHRRWRCVSKWRAFNVAWLPTPLVPPPRPPPARCRCRFRLCCW